MSKNTKVNLICSKLESSCIKAMTSSLSGIQDGDIFGNYKI